MSSAAQRVLLACALLLISALLYNALQHRSLSAQTSQSGGLTLKKTIEYDVVEVGPSVQEIRKKLESVASSGWEFVSPVVQNGTTTALIFKHERK